MVDRAIDVCNKLKEDNINAEVINIRFLKPLDKETIINSVKKTKNCITIEDNILLGGLASNVKELLIDNKIDVNIKTFGYPNKFIKHGSVEDIEKKYGLDTESIYNYVINNFKKGS